MAVSFLQKIREYQTFIKAAQALGYRLSRKGDARFFGYRLLTEKQDYAIYKRPPGGRIIETAYRETVVVSGNRRKTLYIYPDYNLRGLCRKVHFDEKTFKGLLPGSQIAYCRILPYIRKTGRFSVEIAWRLIIVTNRGQIYHNFPAREMDHEGKSQAQDIALFQESVIWDLPGRKYPSPVRDCEPFERYYPGLPELCYEYHPEVTNEKTNQYGGQSFPAYLKDKDGMLCRFYIPRREDQGNSFFFMSGLCADDKMTLLGTYRGNKSVGVRICVFATDDGGRQWFCKYEFGDMGEYNYRAGTPDWGENFGNCLTLLPKGEEVVTGLLLKARQSILPEVQERDAGFSWKTPIAVTSAVQRNTLVLRTECEHGLETGNIVVFERLPGMDVPEKLAWLTEWYCEMPLQFKVRKTGGRELELYEYVASPDNPFSCRHIHHINRVRDGWLVGTGEIYPNSWILYIQMKEADTYAVRSARNPFLILRLNTSPNSIQRTMGLIWRDNERGELLYASDHDDLPIAQARELVPGHAQQVSRGATGIYCGLLRDVDDRSRFQIVYEASEPAYLFDKIGSALVFCGQRGELAVSFDEGKTWSVSHIDGPLTYYLGSTYRYEVFGNYLITLKR